MALTLPTSMDDLLYFTIRDHKGFKAKAWVYKKECPQCHKAKMSKPVNEKTGKPKIRSTEYLCAGCGYSEDKKEHEASCTLEMKYTCPHCGKEGEGSCPYVRKTFMGVKSYIILCEHCSEKIPITKKMKEPKKKKGKAKK